MDQNCVTLFNQAHENYIRGNHEKALGLLKKLLEISRNDKETQACAYFEIGKIYTDISKNELAVKFFKKAISIHPEILVQEFEWFQNLKSRNKAIFNELEKTQAAFKDYLLSRTRIEETKRQNYAPDAESQVITAGNIQSGKVYKYAGFWKRVVATIVVGLVILFVNLILLVILVYGFGITSAAFFAPVTEEDAFFAELAGRLLGYFVWYFVSVILWWLYYAIMESSKCQGTLGKILLGIYVADEKGYRIGVGRATGRYFLKVLLFALPLVNIVDCVMVAVTPKKQAWHDMPVGCVVLSK